ncbi:S8 family serine peptidase [Alteromonas sp. ASW11-130]|uniref:S8 family serine peptidase n=1 Tax=Alteromonas sp. ASW11-130 TaxID=3015775 RepID=UPI002241F836|nr:S8 family serine peptidase [Alteromonas sp. ASW11-130]MCW8091200.1 S8 family serine peptidase [Alteromonas sp. ASW11-130]
MAMLAGAMSSMTAIASDQFSVASVQPTQEPFVSSVESDNVYIVRLQEPAVAVYDGGIPGYEATSAKAKGKKKLNTKSKAAKNYRKFLKNKQQQVLAKASSKFSRNLNPTYTYQFAINGFAVPLSREEAKAMASMEGVLSVQKERMERLLTDVGPQWISAPELWNSNSDGPKGEGMVIAVLDSGINSDHPSFADIGGDGYDHENPLGSGNYLPGSYCDTVDPSFCNDKLIGAWDFLPIDGTVPEDDDGHGSHTASTAAGNVVNGATIVAPTTSASFDISGVAPHANIIAYDVCQRTCPGSALVAAINQVIIDAGNLPNGIAALNYSISGGGDPYNDTVELGFLAAVEAGIYVAASAGNSGPTASTVAHLGPWVSTTAASTHNREIGNSLADMSSDGAGLPDIEGTSFSSGYGPAPIIHANTTSFDPAGQCLDPFPAGTFNGEIVVCDRGTIARTAKGQNVLAGGAGGFVLANLGQGEGTAADAHYLPAIHIGDSAAAELRDWLSNNTNTVATITPAAFNYDEENGDVMAGFSSRGPQLAFNVLKPDITAPGVSIMGAEADGQAAAAPEYQIISGTSMSSPHNAGAGALLAAAHPEWTPTEIKSAIMMTAVTDNTRKEDGETPTDPFDLGAGRIDLGQADSIGLVMSESIENFLAANPETGGDPKTLNLPSMMDNNCVGTCSWTRYVTNKTKHTGHWNVTVTGAGFDVTAEVSPKSNSNKHNLKLKSGETAAITVTATNYDADTGWQFGRLNLTSNGNSSPDLHMPMAVFASKASKPELFSKTVDKSSAVDGDLLTYELTVSNGQLSGPITVTDKIPAGSSFVSGSETESVVNGMTTSGWTYDAGNKTLSWTGELAPGGIDVSMDAGGSIAGYVPLSLFTAPLAKTCNGDCDDGGFLFNVPAYTFNGETYTQTLFSVNGTLEAGSDSGVFSSFNNQDFPDPSSPNNILAPFWRDLNLNDGGNMYVTVLNAGASQWTVYEWEAVPHFGNTSRTVTMQVWIGNNGTPVEGDIHFVYGDMSTGTAHGGTVGAENASGTAGMSYFYNGSGTAPVAGDELRVSTLDGGSATLGFQVVTDCSVDSVINRASLTGDGQQETAIAVTACQ